MASQHLLLSLPASATIATSLGIEGFAWHRSPGSGRHFQDRKILFEVGLAGDGPGFEFLDEGSWRDALGDTRAALAAVRGGKRTKTALSNNAFGCVPIDALQRAYLVKTGGHVLEIDRAGETCRFSQHQGNDRMPPEEIARAVAQPAPATRTPRLYLVIAPVEFILLSNLTPVEYAWYSTHRPGKVFRQVCFTELKTGGRALAAESVYEEARRELTEDPVKKTKTIVTQDCMNHVPFADWKAYGDPSAGGLYLADREHCLTWRLPAAIPREWERAEG